MSKLTVMAGMLMVVAGCATTDPVQPTADAAPSNVPAVSDMPIVASEAGASDRDAIRCKRMVVTGSRVGKSVCHTEEQWAAIKKQSEELVNDINSKASYQGPAE